MGRAGLRRADLMRGRRASEWEGFEGHRNLHRQGAYLGFCGTGKASVGSTAGSRPWGIWHVLVETRGLSLRASELLLLSHAGAAAVARAPMGTAEIMA